MRKIKVLIVDDSSSMRGLFSTMLSQAADIEVVATAEDPFAAREKIRQLQPDVVTLDIEMPRMDGLSFLEKIMALRPMPVIMVSTLTTHGANITLRALELGAVDYITKPQATQESELIRFQDSLIQKVRQAAKIRPQQAIMPTTSPPYIYSGDANRQLVAIGASTGGVEALRALLVELPANMPPVVITQHMPEYFTTAFAKRLNGLCSMQVEEALHDAVLKPGTIYIAPGNYHLEVLHIAGKLRARTQQGEIVSGHRPSVDVMFSSIAALTHFHRVGVILTGMGHDGSQGLLKMRQSGAATLGQSEASCVVYGMPRAAKQCGAVEKELPLHQIAREIVQLCTNQEGGRVSHHR